MTNAMNLQRGDRITVRRANTSSAGGLVTGEHDEQVIFLQHSRRMPGFVQVDNAGATQYVPVGAIR